MTSRLAAGAWTAPPRRCRLDTSDTGVPAHPEGTVMATPTPLLDHHRAAGARLVEFAGWEMPLHYGSQLEEHHAVRRAAGMFDVSHMTQLDIGGADATAFLRRVLANDVARVDAGRALYGCLLNERGGVVDDGLAYRFGEGAYRLVTNAATRTRVLEWLHGHAADFAVALRSPEAPAMIAVQGPEAREHVHAVLPPGLADAARALRRFQHVADGRTVVARTGYTGEDGYEIMLPGSEAGALWDALHARGVAPAGLGARDTLRLEAGLALYGHEMDEETTPLEAGLGWTVAWQPESRRFVGRDALQREYAEGPVRELVGIGLSGRGVARAGQTVHTDRGAGVLTSGGFAPTLERSIGLARVPAGLEPGAAVEVEIRGRRVTAAIERYPFIRRA